LLDGEANGAFPTEVESHCSPVRRVRVWSRTWRRSRRSANIGGKRRNAAASMGANRIGIARRRVDSGSASGREVARAVRFFCRRLLDGAGVRPRGGWRRLAAALVAGGSYVVSHKPATPVAQNQAPVNAAPSSAHRRRVPRQRLLGQCGLHSGVNATHGDGSNHGRTEPERGRQQFLSAVSPRAPLRCGPRMKINSKLSMLTSWKRRPTWIGTEDAEAREHLMEAYQQKALLTRLRLDRIQ